MQEIIKTLIKEGIEAKDIIAITKYLMEEYEIIFEGAKPFVLPFPDTNNINAWNEYCEKNGLQRIPGDNMAKLGMETANQKAKSAYDAKIKKAQEAKEKRLKKKQEAEAERIANENNPKLFDVSQYQ